MASMSTTDALWVTLGYSAQVVFALRFLWQWLISERRKESVVPVSFWYLSLIGGLMLTVYAVFRNPVLVPAQAAGLAIYARNLILIRKGSRNSFLNLCLIGGGSVLLYGGFRYASNLITSWESVQITGWHVFVLVGQFIFAMRFVWQWIVSEKRGECVIPPGFWYLSLIGGTMITIYCAIWDWVLLPGQAAGLPIYARNLILLFRASQRQRAASHQSPTTLESATDSRRAA